jgi:hypothetical protein
MSRSCDMTDRGWNLDGGRHRLGVGTVSKARYLPTLSIDGDFGHEL